MSEENQWRQLGSLVNSVLSETRAKAIRGGSMAPATRPAFTAKIVQMANVFPTKPMGNGFLRAEPLAKPVQLELPFGIGAAPQGTVGAPASPRGARLM